MFWNFVSALIFIPLLVFIAAAWLLPDELLAFVLVVIWRLSRKLLRLLIWCVGTPLFAILSAIEKRRSGSQAS